MLKKSAPNIISVFLCLSSFLINFSCAPKGASNSTSSSDFTYKHFDVKYDHYSEYPPVGYDSDADFDLVFEISVFNDMLENWLYWDRSETVVKVGWALWCSDENGIDFVMTTGEFEFNRNTNKSDFKETRNLKFTRASIDAGKCPGRAVYVEIGGPQHLSVVAPDFLPLAYYNPHYEVIRKGKYPEGIVRRIQSQLPAKTIEIAKIHSAMIKASGTQRDIYCTIQSYTDPLLQGPALELTKIFENQFGSLDGQTIDCNSPLEVQKKIADCQNSLSDDIVFCIVSEKYQQTSGWLSTSLKLLREIEHDSTLSVESAKNHADSLKAIESSLVTFGA